MSQLFFRKNNIATLFYILFLSAVFTSCSNAPKHKFYIGVSQPSKDSWRETSNSDILREASLYDDIEVEIKSVSDDSDAQIADIEYFIEKGVDLLVVSPNESSTLTPIVEKAYQKGIHIILYDRKIDSDHYDAYIGANNAQIGMQMGEYLINALRDNQEAPNIVIIRGTRGSTADFERYNGLMSALHNSPISYNISAVEYGNFTKEGGYAKMVDILMNNKSLKKIDAVVAFNDRMALGAHQALVDTKWGNDRPIILGVDAIAGEDEGIDCILEGSLTASFIYPTGGDVIIDVARKILYRNTYKRQNILNTAVVDKTNARVIKLQREEIDHQQAKIDILNERLYKSSETLLNQKKMVLYMLAIAILAVLVSVLLTGLIRMKNKLNEKLNSNNAQIRDQLEELQIQKNQLQALTAELEEATNAKLVFFTNVSHEFKTPLTLIIGPIKELLESKNIDQHTRDVLLVIYRNSSKLYSLINEVLDFRAYENGKMMVNYEYSNLSAYISDLNKYFNDVIRRGQIEFYYDVSDGDFNIAFDKQKVEKIYFNLMSNAIKHVGPSAIIRTSLRIVNKNGAENIVLSVYNSDSYIPDDKIKDIFLRFYKIGNEMGSSGVGLALTYSLVTLMGGDIMVDSSEYSGTTFIVTLPLLRSIDQENLKEENKDFKYTSERINTELNTFVVDDHIISEENDCKNSILIIEDNKDMLHYLMDILKGEYKVFYAENGTDGVDKAIKFTPDIVVSDIMLPGIDGYEICRRLKSNIKTSNIPILLLTACDLDEQRAMGYESGADGYMQKPFNANVLKVRLRTLIERRRRIAKSFSEDWLLDMKQDISDESIVLLSKMRKYVEEHIKEDISVEAMISALGLSKSNFYRKLKEITEWTPVDIVNLIRLRRAINLVMYGKNNLSEAAFDSGFNSLSYFSRTFVKYYHVPPREWLKTQSGKK